MNVEARLACTPKAFEERYRRRWDPWQFRTSAYERSRYAATLRALPAKRYAFAYEPGCSIGEFTALLAPRCLQLLAMDISPTAVERARERCKAFDHVRIKCGDVRYTAMDTLPDLIVLSELAYYFDVPELQVLVTRLGHQLRTGGTLIAVHWLGKSADHVLHGDQVHDLMLRALPLKHDLSERHCGFRVDRWARR